jgi:hypothetical protein
MISLVVFAHAAVLAGIVTDDARPLERYVIAIGYNAAEPDPRPDLSFADDDAARLFQIMLPAATKSWLLTTFDRESAARHPDLAQVAMPPTLVELSRVLGELAWHARKSSAEGRRTELVFFFAGHGDVTPAGEGYLVFADGRLTRDELFRQVVRGSPTDLNHVILDACASYFMVSARDEAVAKAVPLTPDILDVIKSSEAAQDPSAWARTGVLVSTTSSAAVHESRALSSGVFSYLLRSALLGAGDVNRDGTLEYSEVAAFIASASRDVDDPRARLSVHAAAPMQRPHAALRVLDEGGADRFLRVGDDDPIRLRILDEQGLPYAELHREEGQEVLIALSGSRFFVVQSKDREALLVPRQPGQYALDALTFDDAPRPRADDPLSAALFSSAFGPSYLHGYLGGSSFSSPRAGTRLDPPYAEGHAPPFRVGPLPFAVTALVVALGFGGLSSAALAVNLVGYATIEEQFVRTGTYDPSLALGVELARATAYGAALFALAAAGTAGGLLLYSLLADEVEP